MTKKKLTYVFLVMWVNIMLFSPTVFSADFIGSESCIDCHKEAVDAW